MDINDLEYKLNNIQNDLNNQNNNNIIQMIKDNIHYEYLDDIDKSKINNEYYSSLPKHERLYQIKNDEYKKLISTFSKAYLELSDFYKGPELPRETYLDSRKDFCELVLIFFFASISESYIDAYYQKYCLN